MVRRLTAPGSAVPGRCSPESGPTMNWLQGDREAAEELLRVMEGSTEGGRLIPEQVWDATDIPAAGAVHRQAIRLSVSAGLGPFGVHQTAALPARWKDLRSAPADRAALRRREERLRHFRLALQQQSEEHATGQEAAHRPAGTGSVHWSFDGWNTAHDTNTQSTGLGSYVADLPSDQLPVGADIVFTIYWQNEQRWEGTDYSVKVETTS